MSLLPTSMIDSNASSRYLASRLRKVGAPGPCVRRSATRVTSQVAEPPLGMGFGDRCGDSEGDSGVSEAGDANGKEAVDGSSPSEGLKYLQIGLFCCLI
jgi:hypothetical protein